MEKLKGTGAQFIKASAGSGKTFRLVLEYIALAFQNNNSFRNILAVTFTRAATREMKERIIEELTIIACEEDSAMKEILKLTGGYSDKVISAKANNLLKEILFHYGWFEISTIDSFFQKLIRAFARELNIPMGALIEIDQQKVIKEVTANLFESYGKQDFKNLKKWIRQFIAEQLNSGKSWNIEYALASLASESLKEKAINMPENEDAENLLKTSDKIISTFTDQMKAYGEQALEMITNYQLTIEDFSYGKSGFANYFKKIASTSQIVKTYEIGLRVYKAQDDVDTWYGKKSQRIDDILNCANSGLHSLLCEIISFQEAHYPEFITAMQIKKSVYALGIVSYFHHFLRNYRKEKDTLLISDNTELLNRLVASSDVPFIYEKSGLYLNHILIDEFQDTSAMQWQNFLPLINNSLSQNNKVLLVGDVKQSIYRFRGGDMQLLLTKAEEDLGFFEINSETLEVNRRSYPAIVHFNNFLFSSIPGRVDAGVFGGEIFRDTILKAYSDAVQKFSRGSLENCGYVELTISEEKEVNHINEEDDIETIRAYKAYVTDCIEKAVNNGFHFRDICILIRNNRQGKEIAEWLKFNNIPVVSKESLLLSSSPAVKCFISFMKWLAEPKNEEALLYTLNFLLENDFFIDYKTYHSLLKNKTEAIDLLFESTGHSKKELLSFPLLKLTEKIIYAFNLVPEPDMYMQRLTDFVMESNRLYGPDLISFLEFWEEKKERLSVVTSSDEDAITIMTIHKSKGLQFPVVILPDIDYDLNPHRETYLWVMPQLENMQFEKQVPVKSSPALEQSTLSNEYLLERNLFMLDNLNLLYVATTRAEKCMFIRFNCTRKNRSSPKIQELGQVIFTEATTDVFTSEDAKKEWKELQKMNISTKENNAVYSFGKLDFELKKYIKSKGISIKNWHIGQAVPTLKLKRSWQKDAGRQSDENLSALERGKLIHEILEEILTPSDINEVIEKKCREYSVKKLGESEIRKKLEHLFQLKTVQDWFSGRWKLIREQEILMPGGEMFRPDRVMIEGEKAVIVDFKSGEARKIYEKQLLNYKNSLEEMGYKEVEAHILYFDEARIESIL